MNGLIIAATLAALITFGHGGSIDSEQQAEVRQRPITAADANPVVSIAQGKDYTKTTLDAINRAGGLASIVKPGSTVFIKINIVGTAPSGTGKITDWRVTQAVVDECNRFGASKVVIGESPVDGRGLAAFEAAGYNKVKGAELLEIGFERDRSRLVTVPRSITGQPLWIPDIYLDSDVVIDIPVMKTHGAAGVTLGLKNTGIGIPSRLIYKTSRLPKGGLHDMGMNKAITEVNLIRRPDFTVIDGMVAGEGEGPNDPTPKRMNLVIASRDIVAADTIACMVMGINPATIGHITYADAQGIGVGDPTRIRVVGKPVSSVRADFELPSPYGHPYKRTTVIRQAASTTAVTIDGDLAEWSKAYPNRIGDADQFEEFHPTWKNLSARTMVMHDLDTLYFAFSVNDDVLIEAGDAVEIFLSFDMPFIEDVYENLKVRHARTPGKDFILEADMVLGKVGGDSGSVMRQMTSDDKPIADSHVVFKRRENGYCVEGRLPMASIGRRPLKEREELWMDFSVIDVDKPKGNALRGIWNGGVLALQYDDPSTLGRALVDPIETADGMSIDVEANKAVHPFLEKIAAAPGDNGQVSLFWLGQAGFAIKGSGKTVYVDPYLSDLCGEEYRIFPILINPSEVTNADLILSSHPHDDHYDKLTIPPMMEASPKAQLVLQAGVLSLVKDTLSEQARTRVAQVKVRDTVDFGGIKVTMVPAKHEQFTDSKAGYQNLGFIIDFGGVVVYHTGDSLYWKDMANAARESLDGRGIDVLLVPINGKWGNMTYSDAVKLTEELKPGVVIPMHYQTLSNNTIDPSLFTDLLTKETPSQKWHLMDAQHHFTFGHSTDNTEAHS